MLGEFRVFLQSLPNVADITENNGVMTFRYKGYAFLFVWNEQDAPYIRLMLPKIATKDNLKEGVKILDVINEYNKKYKTIKMFLLDEYIWLSIEQFIYSRDGAQDLFSRIMSILVLALEDFRHEYWKS